MNNLKDIELFLLDMDGTINIEDSLIDGAADFFSYLNETNRRYVFLTNNSSNSAKNYVTKIQNLGIKCGPENVFTSGMAMGIFLQTERANIPIYLVGTKALKEELLSYRVVIAEDYKEAKIVVVGFDKELTYQKLEHACELLDNGAEFLATNVDLVCPIENRRFIPDCGSICMLIETATGKKPRFVGKPERSMVDILLTKFGCPPGRTAIIGDRLYTDIMTGVNAGITSVCVLTGETTLEMIQNSEIKPTYVFDSIKDVYEQIIK